jgi:antitoxin component YwqK of YwqJK toxin-antitoxin module
MAEKVEFHDNGKIKSKGSIVNGLKEGMWLFYFESGKKEKEIYFKDDVEDGLFRRWYEDGTLAIESESKNGISEGIWREYYENGSLKEEALYKNGEYFIQNAWNDQGEQTLINGTGFKIAKFGHLQLDVFKQHFEDGIFLKEEKIHELIVTKIDFPKEGLE